MLPEPLGRQKQAGADAVEVRRDGTIIILLRLRRWCPPTKIRLKNGNGKMNRRKLPGVATASKRLADG
jgi:hypothetical protein